MLISDKYRRPWSDAAHDARRLIRTYDICSAIRSFFENDVTYRDIKMERGFNTEERRVKMKMTGLAVLLYVLYA